MDVLSLFNHSLTKDILVVSSLGFLQIKLLITVTYKFLCKHVFISLGLGPGAVIVGSSG